MVDKTAICTHCSKTIFWNPETKQWEHHEQTPGYKTFVCLKIEYAAPRRGTIIKH